MRKMFEQWMDDETGQYCVDKEFMNNVLNEETCKKESKKDNHRKYPSSIDIGQSVNMFRQDDKIVKEEKDEKQLSAEKIKKILEAKNGEIMESLSRERRSMSDMLYMSNEGKGKQSGIREYRKANLKSYETKQPHLVKFPQLVRHSLKLKLGKHELPNIEEHPKISHSPTNQHQPLLELSPYKPATSASPCTSQSKSPIKETLSKLECEIRTLNTDKLLHIEENSSIFPAKLSNPGHPLHPEHHNQLKLYEPSSYSKRHYKFDEIKLHLLARYRKEIEVGKLMRRRRKNMNPVEIGNFYFGTEGMRHDEHKLRESEDKEDKISEGVLNDWRKGLEGISKKTVKDYKEQYESAKQSLSKGLSIYELKIREYREFLFVMNLCHGQFDMIEMKECGIIMRNEDKYRYSIGKGNNGGLIRSLMERRFWWVNEENEGKKESERVQFVWTQIKNNGIFKVQKRSGGENMEKVDSKGLEGEGEHEEISQQYEEQSQLGQMLQQQQQSQLSQLPSQLLSQPPSQQTQPPSQHNDNSTYKAPLPLGAAKLLTPSDHKLYQSFQSHITSTNILRLDNYSTRKKYFPHLPPHLPINHHHTHMHNHFEGNYHLGNKKTLFYNLRHYYTLISEDVFKVIPLTYHITSLTDPVYEEFIQEGEFKCGKLWIVKPGEQSNRGNGITVINSPHKLTNILKKQEQHSDGTIKTYIVQKYIENPLLYKGRKFDIRHYMLITRLYGRMRAYFYGEGYVRTSSSEYNPEDIDNEMVHLTNDAIQKHSSKYGKFEEGNKLSYAELQRYLSGSYGDKANFARVFYPRMKAIAQDAVRATYNKLDPERREHNFELFGLDYMIDSELNVWLIEINTNPCLELSSKLLSRVIPTMVEQTLRLTLDVVFPPPTHYPNSQKHLAPDNVLERLQYELIFDEGSEGMLLRKEKDDGGLLLEEVQEDKDEEEKMAKMEENAMNGINEE